MKKQLALITLGAILLLSGCDSKSSGGGKSSTPVDTGITLNIGEAVTLGSGDRLVPTSEDARVKIVATPGQTEKEVTLLAGGAKYYEAAQE